MFPRAGGVGAAAAGTDTLAVSSCIVERRGLLQQELPASAPPTADAAGRVGTCSCAYPNNTSG